MPTADLPPDILERAAAHGLDRRPDGWFRDVGAHALVWRAGAAWFWAPETWPVNRLPYAPRFATEAEALAAALDWLDAGEPEVSRE